MPVATTVIAGAALAGVLASTAVQMQQSQKAAANAKQAQDDQNQQQADLLKKQQDQAKVTQQQEQFKKGLGVTPKVGNSKGGTLLTSPLGLGSQGSSVPGGSTLLGS